MQLRYKTSILITIICVDVTLKLLSQCLSLFDTLTSIKQLIETDYVIKTQAQRNITELLQMIMKSKPKPSCDRRSKTNEASKTNSIPKSDCNGILEYSPLFDFLLCDCMWILFIEIPAIKRLKAFLVFATLVQPYSTRTQTTEMRCTK